MPASLDHPKSGMHPGRWCAVHIWGGIGQVGNSCQRWLKLSAVRFLGGTGQAQGLPLRWSRQTGSRHDVGEGPVA